MLQIYSHKKGQKTTSNILVKMCVNTNVLLLFEVASRYEYCWNMTSSRIIHISADGQQISIFNSAIHSNIQINQSNYLHVHESSVLTNFSSISDEDHFLVQLQPPYKNFFFPCAAIRSPSRVARLPASYARVGGQQVQRKA